MAETSREVHRLRSWWEAHQRFPLKSDLTDSRPSTTPSVKTLVQKAYEKLSLLFKPRNKPLRLPFKPRAVPLCGQDPAPRPPERSFFARLTRSCLLCLSSATSHLGYRSNLKQYHSTVLLGVLSTQDPAARSSFARLERSSLLSISLTT